MPLPVPPSLGAFSLSRCFKRLAAAWFAVNAAALTAGGRSTLRSMPLPSPPGCGWRERPGCSYCCPFPLSGPAIRWTITIFWADPCFTVSG